MGCLVSTLAIMQEEREVEKNEQSSQQQNALVETFVSKLKTIEAGIGKSIERYDKDIQDSLSAAIAAKNKKDIVRAKHCMGKYKKACAMREMEYKRLNSLYDAQTTIQFHTSNIHTQAYVGRAAAIIMKKGTTQEEMVKLLDNADEVGSEFQEMQTVCNQIMNSFKSFNTNADMGEEEDEDNLLSELDSIMNGEDDSALVLNAPAAPNNTVLLPANSNSSPVATKGKVVKRGTLLPS